MTSIQGIYIALYGRPADPAGLAYYTAETNGGTDLSSIGDLSSVPEYQDRFADMSSEEIVTSIYESLFERAPDAEGLAFYVALLEESSANINRIAIDILNGAQSPDTETINAKIAAADLFTMHLDTQAEIDAYVGNAAAQVGRDYISDVDADDAGTGEEADAAILKLFPDEGQGPGEEPGTGGGGGGGSGAPGEDTAYRSSDVLLLDGTRVQGIYDIADYESSYEAVDAAFSDGKPGNTVLIQSDELIDDAGGDFIGQLVSLVLPSFADWNADNVFLNIPGADSTITGTLGNDVALVLNADEFTHTITGGRGQDVLVSVGLDFIGGPELLSESVSEQGSHNMNGGNGDDVVISIGGTGNVLLGGGGDDIVASVGGSIDTISGGVGDDIIFGSSDGGQSYAEHFFSTGIDGQLNVRVDVVTVQHEGDYTEVAPRNDSNHITYLGQLANGDRIVRVNNANDSEVSWTVKGGNFEQEITIGANKAAIINVGNNVGGFKADGVTGTATTTDEKPLDLFAEASFAEGDTISGGDGSDLFLYLPEGDLSDSDPGLPFIGGFELSDILSNGADTLVDFSVDDVIALVVNGGGGGPLNVDNFGSSNNDDGFATFAAAAAKANAADKQFYFAADVAGDGYLFIDDDQDGQIDFSIKLAGLSGLEDLSAENILLLDASTLGGEVGATGLPFGDIVE